MFFVMHIVTLYIVQYYNVYVYNTKTLLIKDSASENLRKFDAFCRWAKDSNKCRLSLLIQYILSVIIFSLMVNIFETKSQE